MRAALIVGFFMLAGGAVANEAVEWVLKPKPDRAPENPLVDQMSRCWNIPAGAGEDIAVELIVITDSQGNIESVGIINPAKAGISKAVQQSAARAAIRCAPYTNVPSGEHRVTLDAAEMF